jgi:hypothetical protein
MDVRAVREGALRAVRAAAYFVLDVVSSIPFDLIIQSDGSSATKVAKVIKVFRLLKVSSRVRNFRRSGVHDRPGHARERCAAQSDAVAQLSKVSKTTQYAEQIEDWVGTCTPALSTIPCTLARTLLFSRLRLHEKHSSAVCVCMPPHLHRDCARRCHICTRDWAHPAYICTGTGLTPATSAPGLGAPLRVRAELLALGAHATPLLCATELSRAGGVDMLVSSNLARVI